MIGKASRCAECGAIPESAFIEMTGEELVYLATKNMDEPWLCKNCRAHL